MRKVVNFNDAWFFSKDSEVVTQITEGMEKVTLPHTWNAKDGQDGGNDYYRGTCTYAKVFSKPELNDNELAFMEFEGVAMSASVYLNGHLMGKHEGGYSTFRFDITENLEEENLICVLADNSVNDRVYPQKADFTFYGGIYRDVNLIMVPEEHFELEKDGTPGIKVTSVLSDNYMSATVTVESWQNAERVTFKIEGANKELELEAASREGYASAEFVIDDPHLWKGLEDPYLYSAKAELSSGDTVTTSFGIRKIEVTADKGFFLNGKSYPLRGVSKHQDYDAVGNAVTKEMLDEDMEIVKEIGANTLRLAHYQHSQYFYDLCDKNGIIVWAEIPYITSHMENGRQNTLNQMRELITQCYNHPSIVCWGLSNEITANGSVTEELLDNHRQLNDLCHRMDCTRPTTMANVFMLETKSPLIDISDISSYNLYYGWYLGELRENEEFFDKFHSEYPDRVIGFSEYGADANPAYQSADPERGDYSESYQCLYHEHLLDCIEKRPYLWATHVWNLFDFAADGRDEGGKHGINQKGLVTIDRKTKKDAFYLYKAHWSKESFVHICGRRYVNREGDKTKIKVYSNEEQIALFLDGKEIDVKNGKYVFNFELDLTELRDGEAHDITVKSNSSSISDTIKIKAVYEKDTSYVMTGHETIVNWFDKEEMDPSCYSIRDTMGDLKQSPAAAAILKRVMDKATESRGDVAKETEGNETLQRMLDKMTLESVLKYAGDSIPKDQVKALNAALQKIKKPVEAGYTKDQPLTKDAMEIQPEEPHSAIYPGKVYRDTEGKRIQAHAGAVLFEDGYYYWYGENKDRTDGKCQIWTWGIRAYRSKDLMNWEDLGLIIQPDLEDSKSGLYPEKHVDRPHILKNEKTGKYVCWIKQSGEEACFLILQADSFTGPYEIVKSEYRPLGIKVGDFDMIKSSKDGRTYMFMDADHQGVWGFLITEDGLDIEKEVSRQYENLHAPFCREGVTLFEHEDKIYMLTSGMSGYIPNRSDLAVTDSWDKPFVSIGNPHVNDDSGASFNSQISQIFKLPGKDFYVSIGDRWVPEYPVDAGRADFIKRAIASHYEPDKYKVTEDEKKELMNTPMLGSANTSKADYVWLPVDFKDGTPKIRWVTSWTVD